MGNLVLCSIQTNCMIWKTDLSAKPMQTMVLHISMLPVVLNCNCRKLGESQLFNVPSYINVRNNIVQMFPTCREPCLTTERERVRAMLSEQNLMIKCWKNSMRFIIKVTYLMCCWMKLTNVHFKEASSLQLL